MASKTIWLHKGEEYKEKCMVAYSETWWWQCPYVGAAWALLVSGSLHFIDSIMNSQMYCSILKEKMLPSLCALGRRALLQHDNDPKHTSKATVGFLKKNRVKVIQWPVCLLIWTQSNTYGEFWRDKVEHHSPSSIQSLKEVILEEMEKDRSGKMSPTCTFHCLEELGAVIKNHGGHTKY